MTCCRPSRRGLLRLMAAGVLLPAAGLARTGVGRAGTEPMVATDLEIVTVTDVAAVVTWSTVSPEHIDAYGRPVGIDADTELRIGPADSVAAPVVAHFDATPTPYHYAEVHGLEPGRAYRVEAYSYGMRAVPSMVSTKLVGAPETAGRFTTLVPPPGRLVRTVALSNDVHFGEEVSGLIAGGQPPGFSQDPGLPPYTEAMLDAMLDDLRRSDRGADHLLVAGDVTSEARPSESHSARAKLDSWGGLGRDWFVSRGNHDRPHDGRDSWGDNFAPRQELQTYDLGELRVLAVDTSAPEAAGGVIDPPQLAAVRDELRSDKDRPTLVFGHHPVTFEAATTNIAGPGFVLERGAAGELQQLYARTPGVFLHHSGHTHRNRRTRPDRDDVAVEFLEVGAVKEYPGGYSLLRIYDGGYMVNFYKTRTDLARRWSARTRGQYYGLFGDYAFGTFGDRNHVVVRDLSGLSPAAAR